MNKPLLASALGIGGTGASLTGAYSLGFFEGLESRPSFSSEYTDWKIQGDLENFKSQDKPDCIKKIFNIDKPINEFPEYKTNPTDTKVDISFSPEKKSDGCLIVNWRRVESSDNDKQSKYYGDFRLLWAFAQGNQGFVTYTHFDFDTNGNEKATSKGLVYVMSKKEETGKWEIASQHEVGSAKEITHGGDSNTKVPKPGSALKEVTNFDLWGMKGNKSELVKGTELTSNTKNKEGGSYWKWLGSSGGTEKITDFSSNLNDWWKTLFDSEKNNIPDTVKDISGKWEKIFIVEDEDNLTTQTQ